MTLTTNYSWLGGVTPDTAVGEDDWNRLTEGLDRILGAMFTKFVGSGVSSGWEIQSNGTITAGSGFIDRVACATTTATSIVAQLINSTRNYVYASALSASIQTGVVAFTVTNVATVPAGAIRIGTFDVDSGGIISNVDNNPSDYLRNYYYPIALNQVSGIINATINPTENLIIEVDHSAERIFTIALPPVITAIDAQCHAIQLHKTPEVATFDPEGGFILDVYNNWVSGTYGYGTEAEIQIEWYRWGI